MSEATMNACQEAITKAVQAGEKAYGLLAIAGKECAMWYGTKEKMQEDKAWVVGHIVAGFSASMRTALSLDKGEGTEEQRKVRVAAQKKRSEYWDRILKYAFPEEGKAKDKKEKESKSVDERALALVTAALEYLQKNEGFSFDVIKVATHLAAAKQLMGERK